MKDQLITSLIASAILTFIVYFLMHGSLAGIGRNPILVFQTNPITLFVIIALVIFLYKAYRR